MLRKMEGIKVSFGNDLSIRLLISLYLVSSGLQKSIRRGSINDGMIFIRELIEAGQLNYAWKRIFIYMVEDIGLCNLYVGSIILSLYKLFERDKNMDNFEDKWLYQAVYILCISPKNRENDNMISLISKFKVGNKEDIDFVNKYCIESIYNSKSKKKQKEVLDMLDEDFKNYINSDLYNIYKESLINCWDLNGKDGINLFFINFYLIKKYNIGFDYYKNGKNEWLESIRNDINKFDFNFNDIKKFEIKDYVYDKHSSRGKKLRRGFKHFFEVGAYLENEVDVGGNVYKEEIFRLISEGIIRD